MDRPDYIFAKPDLSRVLEAQEKNLRQEVAQYSAESLGAERFPVTEAALIEKFTIAPLEVDWAQESVRKEEVMERRPDEFSRGRSFQRLEVVLRITVPYRGDRQLFDFSPTSFPNMVPQAKVREGELEFVYQAAQNELARLRQEHDENVGMVKGCIAKVNELLAAYHDQLPAHVRQALESRKNQLNVVDTQLADLGFNIRRHPVPPPVTVPVKRKQIIPPLPPAVRAGSTQPHRILDDQAYDEILKFLADMSVAIERNPSTFADIREEPLRDWFLVALNGAFKGDATGETFNREGKTDISIRVDGNVIFIAECKFWGGEKVLLETIDQLLGYLTWRDSKAGILIFSKNAGFTAVLAQINDVVGRHPNFVRHLPYSAETGFRFVLRNKSDTGREHVVTLLAFHIPKTGD